MKNAHRVAVVVLMVMVFLSTPSVGQNSEKKGWGYGLLGAGGTTGGYLAQGFLHYGGGGEVLFYKGLGVGAELGYLGNPDVLMFSSGVIYAFNTSEKTIPFVTAGYTYFLKDLGWDKVTSNGAFFGGGVNHLIGDNWGIRVEGRDQISDRKWCPERSPIHYLEARFGVLFSWD